MTARLTLDALTLADAPDLHRIVTMPEVGQMLVIFPPDWPLAAAPAMIDAWRWRGAPDFRLAIRRRDDPSGRLIGTVGLRDLDGAVWLAYFLDPACAGQGFASEAVAAFCDMSEARLCLASLMADVFTDNPASARVLEKCGFARVWMAEGRSAARGEPGTLWVFERRANRAR